MANRPIFNKTYDLEYFNGSTASIYIGDTWIDEITSISFQTKQNKTPLYGYASQLFDVLAPGQVLVQGNFTINYKEQGYLWLVLRRWFGFYKEDIEGKSRKDPLTAAQSKKLSRGKIGTNSSNIGGKPIIGSNGTLVSRASVERLVQGKASRNERYQYYQSLGGYASALGKDEIFEDLVESFEDELWENRSDEELISQIRRTDDNIFDGFDIYVVFGNYANPSANHTACKIVGVSLTSRGKSISIDGTPVQEIYEFIAKTEV